MYYFYYMLSHSIVWHLLHVVYNILNMQRLCLFSSWSDMQFQWSIRRRREAANISASMKTFHSYRIVRHFYRTQTAPLAWPTSRVGENCYENVWNTEGFCDMKYLPRSLSRHASLSNHIQNQIALKTFGKHKDRLWLWTNSGDQISAFTMLR